MAVVELQDLSERMFGRETDLAALRARAARPGLTAVTGPPQIGKSFVLRQLAWDCTQCTHPAYIVGYIRSPQGAPDPLLHVVSDLYQRWLSGASNLEQLRETWDQQKDALLPSAAKFAGDLLSKTTALIPGIGDLISGALNGLVAVNQDLRSGQLNLSPLQGPQAQELVSSVVRISKRRVILVMDQWEEAPDTASQMRLFKDYLREIESWPGCHIFVGARDGAAADLLNALPGEFPAAAVHSLAEMQLSVPGEQQRMISYLRQRVPGIQNQPDDAVLNLVGGYPSVIYRLAADDARETVQTFDGCVKIQRDSMAFRYRDLEALLLPLDQDQRQLTARLALVPITESAAAWPILKPIIIAGLHVSVLEDLTDRNVLVQGSETPTFGHATRRAAALAFLQSHRLETLKAEAASLAIALARPITEISQNKVYYASALHGLQSFSFIRRQEMPPLPRALIGAAAVLFGNPTVSVEDLIDGVIDAGNSHEPGAGPVLAMAIFGTLRQDAGRRDSKIAAALLEGLRYLAKIYHGDQAVREQLCNGLTDALTHAGEQADFPARDALLLELRGQIAVPPSSERMQEALALALYNTLTNLCLQRAEKSPGDLGRRDELLAELRAIAAAGSDNATLRLYLSMGIYNTLFCAQVEHDPAHRRDLIEELRALAAAHPREPALREQFAGGLFIAVRDFLLESDHPNAEAKLLELQQLADSHPSEAAIRGRLADALLQTLYGGGAKTYLTRRAELTGRLQTLAAKYPDDAKVKAVLGKIAAI